MNKWKIQELKSARYEQSRKERLESLESLVRVELEAGALVQHSRSGTAALAAAVNAGCASIIGTRRNKEETKTSDQLTQNHRPMSTVTESE